MKPLKSPVFLTATYVYDVYLWETCWISNLKNYELPSCEETFIFWKIVEFCLEFENWQSKWLPYMTKLNSTLNYFFSSDFSTCWFSGFIIFLFMHLLILTYYLVVSNTNSLWLFMKKLLCHSKFRHSTHVQRTIC